MKKLKRKTVLIWDIIVTVIYTAALPVAIFGAIFSMMLADGGTELRTQILIYSYLSLPIIIGISIILSWIFFGFKKYRTSLLMFLVPIINAFLIALLS